MIDIIISVDYEIFGNGDGNLKQLVFKPIKKFKELIDNYNWKFVCFAEVAELIKINEYNSDNGIGLVEDQLRKLYHSGNEIALHIHPQWFRAKYDKKSWLLDYTEYNLCNLSPQKIQSYISQSIAYLKCVISDPCYNPISFRAGSWLLQPSHTISYILRRNGIIFDSSVYKGGVKSQHKLNYKPSLKNGYYWRFSEDVNKPDENGILIEIPIFSKMVPIWRLYCKKRARIMKEISFHTDGKGIKNTFRYKIIDRCRLFYPKKFDICKMTLSELKNMLEEVIHEDNKSPEIYKPVVLIAHSKNLSDFEMINYFFDYMAKRNISVTTFSDIIKQNKIPNCTIS